MASLLLSRRDLDFLLYEWLDAESLTQRPAYQGHDRATFDAVLDLAEQVATRDFAPHNRRNDDEEPTFDGTRVHLHDEIGKALKAYADAGFIGAGMPEAVGGMQLPATIAQATIGWFQAANVGSSAYAFLTIANANLLLAYGTPEQVETYVKPMVEGRYFGTMCLSEPQAGSSLADITTRAEPQPDGSHRLTGNKMWISGGDHELSENIVHLVLARIPGSPPGAKGISLFLVPKVLPDGSRNDVVLAGLNHKMGYRGTVNALLNFGEKGGATGWLVGKENEGLTAMFHMMNEARIGVGLGATALGYSGYLHALDYARTRPQGRLVGAKDPTTPMVPLIEHPDVRRMLLASKSYVEGSLALNLYCGRLVDEERTGADPDRSRLLLDVLTPIAKSWPAQWCLLANDHAIQVHGGYGYTREYAVEQLYRDNRLNPIHEGTHGIQALDLLGRKVTMQGGAGLELLRSTIAETVERAREEHSEYAEALSSHIARVIQVTQILWGTGDPALALANASAYLEAVGHVVVAWMWLEQLVATGGKEGDFYDGKRAAAEYFFRWELPKTDPQLDLLASLNRTTLDMKDTWF
ncbi:MAG: acyl-CoA dehydrogenase [Actinomycetota bacterium]|nr:acyl-CoA dehydrogenase [Actinomycetota bacterium]